MRAIIIGAGKIGFSIAQMLSIEEHDVVVIEKKEERQKIVAENLDVQVILGNGADTKILEEAGIEDADLLIAVTEVDELNMIACLTAKKYGVKKTIARIRNPEYLEEAKFNLREAIGIDLVINPERVTAQLLSKIIKVPEAINIEYYADGKVQLLELRLTEESPIVNKPLKEIDFPKPSLVVAILRDEKMIIPRGDDYLKVGDIIFIIAETAKMMSLEKLTGKKTRKTENVVILGGGRIGYYLAKLLEKEHISVKVIDKDIEVCKKISEELDNTLVLHGDGTDISLLEEENIEETDFFIAVTNDDKVNLLVSLLAKHLGAKKVAAQIRHSDYIPLVEKVGVDVAISPRTLTASAILKFIRKGNFLSVTLLETRAEMLELLVSETKKFKNKNLSELRFPRDAIIGAIVRGDEVLIPTGEDYIKSGDHLMIFALPGAIKKVEKFFSPS